MVNMNGSINLDETEFQQLFELYWNSGEDSKARGFVIEELNKYIYFYVTNRFQAEFDTGSDFFVENIANTKKWLEEYEPAYGITFLVYFTSKVKRRLFNYRIKIQKLKKYENLNEFHYLDHDEFIESVFEERKPYFVDDSYEKENKFDIQAFTNICLTVLKEDEQVAIKLFYGFSLSYKDFRYLAKLYDLKNVFMNYRKYHAYLNNKLKSEKAEREILSKKLYVTSINMREIENPKIFIRRQRLLTYFEDIKNLVPLRLIAEVFQLNITNVYRKVKRGKKKLKNLLSGQLYLNFEDQRPQTQKPENHKPDENREVDYKRAA
jgi:hypothetical protein